MSRTTIRVACSKCQRRSDPWRKFCGACGGALTGGCTACGTVNEKTDKFCGGCARSLVAAPAPVVAPASPAVAKAKPPPVIPKAIDHTVPIAIIDDAVMAEVAAEDA